MTNKKYLAVSGLNGPDALYVVNKTTEKKFEKLFGKFDSRWKNHEDAVEWLRGNAKYVATCSCVSV